MGSRFAGKNFGREPFRSHHFAALQCIVVAIAALRKVWFCAFPFALRVALRKSSVEQLNFVNGWSDRSIQDVQPELARGDGSEMILK